MRPFLHRFILVGLLPFLLFSTCHPGVDKEVEARLAALRADDLEMVDRFKEASKATESLPVEQRPELRALNMALDASSADEVKAILTQYQEEPENQNRSPISLDSTQLDSMLSQPMQQIENGAILMGVRDYEDTYAKIRELVNQFNAKIESEEERTTEFRLENTLVIHVAPEKFQQMMVAIRQLSVLVREKRLWKQDLTTQFVDLKARLDSKYEAKKRLEQFMKSAEEAEDVLPIQRELDAVTEEIEAVTKAAKALTDKLVYSTITVTFYQEVMESSEQKASFGDRFAEGARSGWTNFKEFLITVAQNWPYVVIGMVFFLVIVLAVRTSRRRSRQFKMKAMQAQQQWILQQKGVVPPPSKSKSTAKNS